jgi:two-component system cell cycle sensor histidine kinase/response regulator CckA
MSKRTDYEIKSAASLQFDAVKPGVAVPAVFWTTDAQLRVTSVQGNGQEQLGVPFDELIGASLQDHLPTQGDTASILNAHHRALAGESICFEAKVGDVSVEIYLAPQRDDRGSVSGTIGMAKVGSSGSSKKRPVAKEDFHHRVFTEKSTDVIVLADGTGKIHFVSPGITTVLGYSQQEFVGQNGFGFVHPDDDLPAHQMFEDVLSAHGRSRTEEFRVRAKDGSWKQLEVTTTNLLDDATIHSVVVNFRDISARKRAESERLVMIEIIQALNLTANLDELLERMHRAMKSIVRAENFFIALHDNATGMFHFPFVADRHDDPPPPQKAGRTCSAYVYRSGKTLLANRETFDELVKSGEIELIGTPAAAWLGVPLRTLSGIIGVLVVQSYDDENAFSQRDVELVVSIASQIALAIERKRAEDELRKRESEHSIIFNSAPTIIIRKDRASIILRANKAAGEFFGVPPEQLHGKHVSEVWPDEGGLSEKEDLEVMETGRAQIGVMTGWRTAAGEEKIIHTHRVPYRDHNGVVAGVIVFATDITEQRRSREMLDNIRRQNELILQCAGEGICGVDREGLCTMINPAVTALSGWTSEDLLGKNPQDYLHHSRPDGTRYTREDCPLLDMYDDGIPRRIYDEVFWRKDGSSFPVEYFATPIQENGVISGAVITFRDVSEQHHARKVLRESEARYRLLVENAAYGIFRTATDGTFLDANNALATMLGYSLDELLKVNAGSVYAHPEVREPLVATTMEKGFADGVELQWVRKDGQPVMVRLSARLIRDPNGEQCFEGIVENVTEWRALETQLRQAQKMEAVGRLAGGVAHDFNNLLMVIKGHTELLMERTAPEHPDFRKIDQIKKAADRAAALTRQLLAFSRMQVMQPRVIDLNGTITEMGKMLPRLIGEDIELAILTKPHLGHVKADAGQMEQVILNLTVNARDAMPHGGKLLIETSNVDLDETYARTHPPLVPGRFVMLAVTDTGIGMDAATQAHIFEPFFTTKEKGKGTGLGLATVYGVVKQSNGFVWVYSELGKGTTFKIYLPRVDEAPEAESERKRKEELPVGSGKILLAEDEKEVREVAREFLEMAGYTVIEAKDGADALAVAERHTEKIDLLVTDMVMPGIGGRELATRLLALRPGLKVIYMSGYTEYANFKNEDFELRNVMLQKPFTRAALAAAVHQILGDRPR